MEEVIQGKPLIPGYSSGEALVSDEPLSFWGGYNYQTGEIIDQRHPLSGFSAAGKILAVPFTRGSSSTTAVLLEAIRCMRAPAAILTTSRDPFLALASIVAQELYCRSIPVIALPMTDFRKLKTGDFLEIDEHGTIRVNPPKACL
jgi:phosphomecalonate degydratase small subunit